MKYEKGSFITIPNKQKLLSVGGMEQALFMWLCDMANVTGDCFPSRTTLAAKLQCSVRSVDEYMNALVKAGLVIKENRFKGNEKQTNLYSIPLSSGAEFALPRAEFAPPLGQNLPIELNPVLTQKNTAKAVYTIEEEKPKTKTPKYEKALKWAEERMGHKFVHRTKQYAAIKRAINVGITGDQLLERWEELESKPFFQDNGFDWTTVVSSFDRK